MTSSEEDEGDEEILCFYGNDGDDEEEAEDGDGEKRGARKPMKNRKKAGLEANSHPLRLSANAPQNLRSLQPLHRNGG